MPTKEWEKLLEIVLKIAKGEIAGFLDKEIRCKFFNRRGILLTLDEIEDRTRVWDAEIRVRYFYKGLKIEELPTLFTRTKSPTSTVKFFKDIKHYSTNLVRFIPKTRRMKHGITSNTRRPTS